MLKRKFHKLLSEGEGRQLLWLLLMLVSSFILFWSYAAIVYKGWSFTWQDLIALYLDGGTFAGPGEHDGFRLLIAFVGVFLFSALLISAFTNIFENISESYKKGEAHYRFKNHILILGSNYMLKDMLIAIRNNTNLAGKNILVMTTADVEQLRATIDTLLSDASFCDRITYFHNDRSSKQHLIEACADKASVIYLIGEDEENDHDAINIRCNDFLKEICGTEGPAVNCFMTLDMHSSLDVFQYLKKETNTRLNTEIINISDYVAEQLLVKTDFLPALSATDTQRLHVVIAGFSRTSRAFANVVAQVCHYPNFYTAGRTLVTFIDSGMRRKMDDFWANRQSLSMLSHYRFVSENGTEEFQPDPSYGDFLDIEWEFIDSHLSSPFSRKLLEKWASDANQKMVMAICYDDESICASAALHLPKILYDKQIPLAVYQKEHLELMDKAVKTGMYGCLSTFGEASSVSDALFLTRSLRGMRVNHLYDMEYGNPPSSSPEEAWHNIPYAYKLSSIASANAIPLSMRCYDLQPTRASIDAISDDIIESLSEMEHRRWMMSVLLMGYSAATATMRKDRTNFKYLKNEKFIHLDIAPYSELFHEAEKDKLIVSNIPFIITGDKPVKP